MPSEGMCASFPKKSVKSSIVNKPAVPETAFRFEQVNGVGVFYWSEDGRGYALSGDLTREELLPIARSVYDELNAPAPKAGG